MFIRCRPDDDDDDVALAEVTALLLISGHADKTDAHVTRRWRRPFFFSTLRMKSKQRGRWAAGLAHLSLSGHVHAASLTA